MPRMNSPLLDKLLKLAAVSVPMGKVTAVAVDAPQKKRQGKQVKLASGAHVPPPAVRAAAARGLELRARHGKGGLSTQEAGKQGIGSGVARARDLAGGKAISTETLKRMSAFFSRHRKNKSGGEADAGHIAWQLWGGDAGEAWVRGQLGPRTQGEKGQLIKLAYGWDDINRVSSMTKKLMVPKRLRAAVATQTGTMMGTKGGKMGTYQAVTMPSGSYGIVTPESGGMGGVLRKLTKSSFFRLGRTPYQAAALDALKHTRMNGPQQKALNSVIHGHEMDEIFHASRRAKRGLGPSPVTEEYGHQSPDVLLREHNRLTTLPAEVRAPVTSAMKKLRAATGDADAIEDVFKGRFSFGDSPRLSRHARKRMTEALERRYVEKEGWPEKMAADERETANTIAPPLTPSRSELRRLLYTL